MKQSTKKYLQDLFDGKYKDEPTLNSKEFLQAEKEFLTDIEKFKMKFNKEEISDAIDELTESFTKYESVVRREAFIVGIGFGMRMGWLSTHQIKISFIFWVFIKYLLWQQ